jgi:uncharacterized protein (TIGR02246 family)
MDLTDREQIADLVIRCAVAQDRKDWDTVARTFLEDAVYSHPGGRLDGRDAIVDRTREALEHLDASQHLLGSQVIEVDVDRATSLTYFQAQHVKEGTPGGDLYTVAGTYADSLVRTPDGWRIAERTQSYRWRSGNRDVVAR